MIKSIYSSIIGLFFTIQIFCFANTNEINPLDVHVYQLENGLTVYLNEDHNTTSVFGAVAVRGGGKRDPKDATGIAHYLEHLLFKGTDKMGTTNYELEGTGRNFSLNDIAIGLSYAKFMTDKFSVGANIYYVKEAVDLYKYASKTIAFDIGTFYITGFNTLNLGMTIKNFGPELDFNESFG